MEFLVRFEATPPADMSTEERDRLRSAERERAAELRAAGTLVRLWRVPGTRGVVGLWNAEDATELHASLASLPMFPWFSATVEPLATHPQEQSVATSYVAPDAASMSVGPPDHAT
jgi:muconolactone D-isomerase